MQKKLESDEMKRIIEFSLALAGIIFLLPLLIMIAILVKWQIGTPIIFKQQRPGLHGIPFYLYKFRTMTTEVDRFGMILPDHERMTVFGTFLRKYSLDELPQLLNVLKGDLSLVGPRPLLMEYLPLYTEEQAKRHLVKPGLTGWAQVNGRNAITWEDKFQLDVWYVNNQSLLLDFKIVWLTALKVVRSEGVTIDEPYFNGSGISRREGHGT